MKYKNPPVVETVLSVQFEPIRKFGAAQLGEYCSQLRQDWPHVSEVPAVEPKFERFEPAPIWEPSAFRLKLSQQIDLRLQISNEAKDRMIQIQNGRFFYNWLGSPEGEYPSYDEVRPEFDQHWKRFQGFIESRLDGSKIEPNQWEVLYVNHIPKGGVWKEIADVPQVFTFLQQPDLLGLCFEGLAGEWRYEIGEQQGRLYVNLGMKEKTDAGEESIIMTLTARGAVSDAPGSLNDGLNLGHSTITDAFDQMTSPEAKKVWGVEHANS